MVLSQQLCVNQSRYCKTRDKGLNTTASVFFPNKFGFASVSCCARLCNLEFDGGWFQWNVLAHAAQRGCVRRRSADGAVWQSHCLSGSLWQSLGPAWAVLTRSNLVLGDQSAVKLKSISFQCMVIRHSVASSFQWHRLTNGWLDWTDSQTTKPRTLQRQVISARRTSRPQRERCQLQCVL